MIYQLQPIGNDIQYIFTWAVHIKKKEKIKIHKPLGQFQPPSQSPWWRNTEESWHSTMETNTNQSSEYTHLAILKSADVWKCVMTVTECLSAPSLIGMCRIHCSSEAGSLTWGRTFSSPPPRHTWCSSVMVTYASRVTFMIPTLKTSPLTWQTR